MNFLPKVCIGGQGGPLEIFHAKNIFFGVAAGNSSLLSTMLEPLLYIIIWVYSPYFGEEMEKKYKIVKIPKFSQIGYVSAAISSFMIYVSLRISFVSKKCTFIFNLTQTGAL